MVEELISKVVKTTCCRSFLTPKGRCFDCVDEKYREDIDNEEDMDNKEYINHKEETNNEEY